MGLKNQNHHVNIDFKQKNLPYAQIRISGFKTKFYIVFKYNVHIDLKLTGHLPLSPTNLYFKYQHDKHQHRYTLSHNKTGIYYKNG